jgi:cytochrome P450
MTQLYNFTTFDTMAQLCFGHSLGMLQENKSSPWVQSVFDSLKMMPFATMIAYYPILTVLFAYFEPKSITAQRKVHCQFSADRVDQRLHEGSEKPDVWNLVLSAQEAGNEVLSLKEMHSNAELFMLAGSETTGRQIMPHYDNLADNTSRHSYLAEWCYSPTAFQSRAKGSLDHRDPHPLRSSRRYHVRQPL